MTTRAFDRCLAEPLWWCALLVAMALVFALLRIPVIFQSADADTIPLAWIYFPPLEMFPVPYPLLALQVMATLTVALIWPMLVLAAPGMRPVPVEVALSPAGWRHLYRRQLGGSLALGTVLATLFIPILTLAVKTGQLAAWDAGLVLVTLYAQWLWIPCCMLHWTLPHSGGLGPALAGWLFAIGLTLAVPRMLAGPMAGDIDLVSAIACGHLTLALLNLLWAERQSVAQAHRIPVRTNTT